MCWPDLLEMKMTRPQFFFSIPGKYFRVRRTPLSTFTEKSHSFCVGGFRERFNLEDAQVVHHNICLGHLLQKCIDSVRRTQIHGDAAQFGWQILSSAATTRASVRPLTTAFAHSAARVVAIANPIPAVEPDTTTALPRSPRSILVSD
jgi:hypothetical protein